MMYGEFLKFAKLNWKDYSQVSYALNMIY